MSPSHQRAVAQSRPVGHPDVSLHRLHGRSTSPQCRRHQVEEEWRRQSNPAWSPVGSRSRTHVPRGNGRAIWPWPWPWSQPALVLAVEDNPTRSDAVVLPSAVVACETCTQGPHQPTVNVWLSTQNIPDFSSAGPQRNKLGKRCRCQRQSQGQAKPHKPIVRHARHWHAAIQTTLSQRDPQSPRVSPREPSKPAGQGGNTSWARGSIECGQD